MFGEDVLTKQPTSKEIAKERLKNILLRDRVDVSAEVMEAVREDMISVVSDYFTICSGSGEVYLTNMKKSGGEANETVLVCLVPVGKLKKN